MIYFMGILVFVNFVMFLWLKSENNKQKMKIDALNNSLLDWAAVSKELSNVFASHKKTLISHASANVYSQKDIDDLFECIAAIAKLLGIDMSVPKTTNDSPSTEKEKTTTVLPLTKKGDPKLN